VKRILARWESCGGKHWAELYADEHGYGYEGNGCGGTIPASSDSHARALMQVKVDSGYFLPDDARMPPVKLKLKLEVRINLKLLPEQTHAASNGRSARVRRNRECGFKSHSGPQNK
jgi:hypothetical protein